MVTTSTIDPRILARRGEVKRLEGRRRLRMVMVLIAAAVGTAVGWWIVMASPVFDVDQVEVVGTTNARAAQVIEAAAIREGKPLVEINIEGSRAAVAALPWVDTVSSKRTIGGTVEFTVTERLAVAAVASSTGWLMLDDDGRVIEHVASVGPDVVVVEAGRWDLQPGDWVGEAALTGVKIAEQLPASLQAGVASVRATEGLVELALFGGGTVWLSPSEDLEPQFLATLTILDNVSLDCVDRIDVRAAAVPVLTRVPNCS